MAEELEQEFKDLEKESNSLPKKKSKRLKESDYTGAENIHLPHDSLKAGDPCPTECGGRLYALKPGAVIRSKLDPHVALIKDRLDAGVPKTKIISELNEKHGCHITRSRLYSWLSQRGLN